MNGQINNGVWVQVKHPRGKTVLGTKTLFERDIRKDGQIEKYKCCFVTQGFRCAIMSRPLPLLRPPV